MSVGSTKLSLSDHLGSTHEMKVNLPHMIKKSLKVLVDLFNSYKSKKMRLLEVLYII